MHTIVGIRRLDETLRRFGAGGEQGLCGDNWHMTWSSDDEQYVALCDGQGWPNVPGHTGESYNTRVYAIKGELPHITFRHLPGFPDLLWGKNPENNRYYGFGVLSVDSHIYHFLSTPNHPFDEPKPRFVGAKLIFSPDDGHSWKNQDGSPVKWEEWSKRDRGNMVFFHEPGDAFSLLSVLQFGKHYELNRDGYIYVFAPNGNQDGTMNQLVMFRTDKHKILERASYEFFVSCNADGSANWSHDINARGVVHTFPSGWVNSHPEAHPYGWHPSIVYNAPLGLYMMVNWGMGCSADGKWFGKPSYLGFWIAEQPWGPWTQVHEETEWTPLGDPLARVYQPQISPKWISKDGKSLWLVFTDFQKNDDKLPYYCFNCQKVEVLTK